MRRDPIEVGADVDERGVLRLDIPTAQHRAMVRARFAGQRVDVVVRVRRSKRSDRQNRALHAALAPFAEYLGYTLPELKTELLGLLWGYEEHTSKLTGEITQRPKRPHTSVLNTADFAELMEFAAMKAAETGYYMPLPDEWKAAKEAERKKRERAA